MIKMTSYQRDPQNLDNVLATIEYDINGVPQTPFNIDAPMVSVEPMNTDEIKDFIRGKVAKERGDALWTSIDSKLSGIQDEDLEAP